MFAVNQCDPARFITVHFRQLTRLVKLMRAAIKNINYLVHKLCSAKTKFLVIPSYYLQFYFIFLNYSLNTTFFENNFKNHRKKSFFILM